MRTKLQSLIFFAGVLISGLAFAAPLADGASKFLGNITTNGQVRTDFGTYWNQITAENECKWGSIESSPGKYDFTGCDRAYNWAKNNGGKFKFHALLWGAQFPRYLMKQVKDANGNWVANSPAPTLEGTKTAIKNWFDAVAAHYPDLDMIDVVNEAIRTGTNQYHSDYTNSYFIEALGGDNNGDYTFVTTAFKMARDRWPKAVLIYNDYNTFQWNVDLGIDLVKKIKAAGAPVDAYGQQAHDMMGLDGKCMNFDNFKATLKKIHDQTQLPLFITEYDIGTDDDAIQKQCYSEQIPEFMNAEYVAGITLWGYIYGSTWVTGTGIIKNGADRPAMTWLKQYMATNKGVNTTGLLDSKPDTVPQAPYSNAIAIPGTVEAENYDVGGQNQSYYDTEAANQGNVYRQDQVDIVAIPNGNAIGYTIAGEWLEYTVNVTSAKSLVFDATVSSGLDGSSIRLFMDNQAISDTIKIPNGGNWDTYTTVTGNTSTLTAGTHILKIAITGSYVNLDKIKFSESVPTQRINSNENLLQRIQRFDIYSAKGVYLQSIDASNITDLQAKMQSSNLTRGAYFVRNSQQTQWMLRID